MTFAGAARWLLPFIAICWPFGIYQYVPQTSLGMSAVAGLLLIALAAADAALHRRFRIPFELAWPPALIALLGVYGGELQMLWLAALFTATAHFVEGPAEGRRLLLLSAAASAFICAFSIAAYALQPSLWPTLFSLDHGGTMFGPHTPVGGLFVVLAAAGGGATWLRATSLPHRVLGAAVIGAAVGAAALALPLWQTSTRATPVFAVGWATAALWLWLAGRVAAKSEVQRQEKGDHVYLLSTALITAGAIAALWLGTAPSAGMAFILGASAGAARRRPAPLAPLRRTKAPAVVLLILVLPWNSGNVSLNNSDDPRNYYVAAQALMAQERHEEAFDYAGFFLERGPESRARHVQALASLRINDPETAAVLAAEALKTAVAYQVLPRPTARETAALRASLREAFSARNTAAWAYWRYLAALGEEENAVALMRQTARGAAEATPELWREPLGRGIAAAAGLSGPEALGEWTTGELLLLLKRGGALVQAHSSEQKETMLLAALPNANAVDILAFGSREAAARLQLPVRVRPGAPAVRWIAESAGYAKAWLAANDSSLAQAKASPIHLQPLAAEKDIAVIKGRSALLLFLPAAENSFMK